jgi:hypothetical protein
MILAMNNQNVGLRYVNPTYWIIFLFSVLFHIFVIFGIKYKYELSPTIDNTTVSKPSITVTLLTLPININNNEEIALAPPTNSKSTEQKTVTKKQQTINKTRVTLNESKAPLITTDNPVQIKNEQLQNKLLPKQPQVAVEKIVNKFIVLPDSNRNEAKTDKNKVQSPALHDWNAIAKEVIGENFEHDIEQNRRQDELRMKSPSDMYGKQKNYFDKQNTTATLADNSESKQKSIFPNKKKKSSDIGFNIGNSCFLGFKAKDDTTYDGSSTPFSCDF